MAANSKRAKLGPQIMGGSAAPAGSLRTMAIARRNPHGAAAEPLDTESAAAAPTETPAPAADELFYKKGAATAATFRPNYWTYESNRAAVEASEGLEGSVPSEEELSASDTAGLALVVRPSQPPANDPPPAAQAEPAAILPEGAPATAEVPDPDFAEPAPEFAATTTFGEVSSDTADSETPLVVEAETPAIVSEVATAEAAAPEPDSAAPAPEAAVMAALDEPSLIAADIETPLAAEAEAPEPDFAETTPEPAAATALDEASFEAGDIEMPLAVEAEAPTILSEVAPAAAETIEPDFAEPAPEPAATAALDEASFEAGDIEMPLAVEAEAPMILSEVAPAAAEMIEPDFAEPAPEPAAATALDEASFEPADTETPLAVEAEAPETLPEPAVSVALDEASYEAAKIETPLAVEAEVPATLSEVAPAVAEASEPDFAELGPDVAVMTTLDEASPGAVNIEMPLAVETEAPTILSEAAPVAAEALEPDFAELAPEPDVTTALDEPSSITIDVETLLTAETEAPAILSEAAPAAAEAPELDFAELEPEPDVTTALDEPGIPPILHEVAPAAAKVLEPDCAEREPEPAVTATLDEPSSEAENIETPLAVETEAPAILSEAATAVAETPALDCAEPAPEPVLAMAPDAAPGIDVSEPPASDKAAAFFDAPAASETAPPSPSVALDEAPRSDNNDLPQGLHAAVAAPFEPATSMSFEDHPAIEPETVAAPASQAMPAQLEPVAEEPAEEESAEAASDFNPNLESSLPAPDAALWEAAEAGAVPAEIEPPTTGFIAPALAIEAPPSVAIEEAEPLAAAPIAPPSDLDQASLACEAHPAAEPDIATAVGEASETIAPAEAAPIIAAPPARKEKRPDPRLAAERAAQDAGAVELAAMIESVLIDKSYQKAARSAVLTPLSTAMRMSGRPRARALRPIPAPTPATPPKPLAPAAAVAATASVASVAAIASVAPKRRASNRLLVLVCLGVILPATFYATALRHGDTEDSATLAVAAPAAPLSEDLTPETVSAFNETMTPPFHAAPIRPAHKPHHPAAKHQPVR